MPEPDRRATHARQDLRLTVRPTADPRDVGARLDRALQAASRDHDGRVARQTRPVQVVAEAHHDPEAYRRWRADHRRRAHGAAIPELADEDWALVLWAMPPSAVAAFTLDESTREVIGAPLVGVFATGVEHDVAVAATLAAWLKGRHAMVLAPPLLTVAGTPYRMLALKRGWPLPIADLAALAGRRGLNAAGLG